MKKRKLAIRCGILDANYRAWDREPGANRAFEKLMVLIALCISALKAEGQPVPAVTATTNAATTTSLDFRETSPGMFELGKVTLNKRKRAVSFPVQINMRSNIVEYAVVTRTGKTHESLFRTDVDPMHIHLAMLLLGAKPANVSSLGGDPKATIPGQPIHIEAHWTREGHEIRVPLENLLAYTTNHQKTLPRGTWTYNGSYLNEGRFMAKADGSIISLQEDSIALVNNPNPSRFFDDLHMVNTPALPPDGLPIEMEFLLKDSVVKTNTP
ncbi:MAG: hypothetical protein IPK15_22435 [Verrucomicrobia bacterium]|nr:hypothetical protein [Verrucomicrobiota bacterium]